MLTGSNLTYTKQYNLRIVHEVIRLHGPLSRSDVARRTELTVQTVSNLVKELMALGLVREGERRQERRGAPSTVLALDPDGAFSIGLDLDRDHLIGVLMDMSGRVRQRQHVRLDFPSPAEALELMVAMADGLIAAEGVPRSRVAGVGVGVPGPMYRGADGDDYLVSPRAFAGWREVPLAAWLRERLRMAVLLENNATAAAMGERWYGAGQRYATFFYLYFGSGLGGGLVVNGQRFDGCSGNAGEIGYFPAPATPGDDDRQPHVGMHFNLPRLYERLRADGMEARTPDDLASLYSAGHPGLRAWVEGAVESLIGIVLAAEYLVDPSAIFFGGRLPDSILQAIMEGVAERVAAARITERPSPPVHLLGTAGEEAAALGVATIPLHELFAPVMQVLLKSAKGEPSAGLGTLRAARSA